MATFDELLEQLRAAAGGGDGEAGDEGASTVYDDLRNAHQGALDEGAGNLDTANMRIKELEEELSAAKAANFDSVMEQPADDPGDAETVDGQDVDDDGEADGYADDDAEYNSFDDLIGKKDD